MSGKTRWALLAEGLVVIVSILIAFGLDAWWDQLRSRVNLVDDLVNVGEELEANLATLEFHILMQRTAVASLDDLATRATSEPKGSTIIVPDTILLAATIFTPTYDPSTGAVDALIARGGLSQLRDRQLQSILAEFRTVVEDIREDELGARRAAHQEILPLLWEDDEITPVFGRVNEYYSRGLEQTPLASSPVRITNAPGISNRLSLRRAWLISALRELEGLKSSLELAHQLLLAEMGAPD